MNGLQPTIFKYNGKKFEVVKNTVFDDKTGFWYSVTIADLDGDGDNDMVLGNVGENCYLADRNEPPLKLWINDFDDNGYVEKFITNTYQGKDVPEIMKRDMVKELPSLKKQVLKHHDYAKKSFQDLFSKEKIKKSIVKEARYFKSVIAINDGKGHFTLQELPLETQLSSMCVAYVQDVNADGKLDIIMGGNHFTYLPQYGRNDGSYGEVLINQGDMKFLPLSNQQSGLFVVGMLRDIKPIKIKGEDYLLFGINNSKPQLYKVNSKNTEGSKKVIQ